MTLTSAALFAGLAALPLAVIVVVLVRPDGRIRLRASLFQMARMAYQLPWQALSAGLGYTLLGGLFLRGGHPTPGRVFGWAGLIVLAVSVGWWWFSFVARPHSVGGVIRRRAELDQRTGGVASRLDIAEHASPKTLRLKAHILRPSLRDLPKRGRFWQARVDVTQVGVEIARLGWGWWGERLWSSCEDATGRIGGPRTGKTLSLAAHGEDAPGALITTSTRLDLAEMVHLTRSARGRVHFFNPAGLGGLPSTVRWRVLDGCGDFATAQRRAADLVPESFGEGERWDGQARRILALLLHAAAVSGRSMRDVTRWIADPNPANRDEVVDALQGVTGTGDGARDRAAAVRQFWATNDRTKTSITTTMATPLAWMSDDRARTLGDADPTHPDLLDVAELILRGETLHLIGHEDQGGLSPLIGALVAEIAHTARTLAASQYRGRLDPPLTMLLDEAALVCPVPLDRWTADMGGRGVTLHISVQSLSQLRQRWGADGAGTILANLGCFIVFGGSTAAQDLRDISLLTGEHRMRVVGADHDRVDSQLDGEQRGEYRWVPVLSPAQIRALESGQVVVMRRGLHIAVGWAPMVTARRGWQQVSLIDTLPGANLPTAGELEAMLQDAPSPRAAHLRRAITAVTGRPIRAWQHLVARLAARADTGAESGPTVVDLRSHETRVPRPATGTDDDASQAGQSEQPGGEGA